MCTVHSERTLFSIRFHISMKCHLFIRLRYIKFRMYEHTRLANMICAEFVLAHRQLLGKQSVSRFVLRGHCGAGSAGPKHLWKKTKPLGQPLGTVAVVRPLFQTISFPGSSLSASEKMVTLTEC
jgi:hypothetical protein